MKWLYNLLLLPNHIVEVLTTLKRMETKMDQATTDILSRIDAATNKVAARLQALVDQAAKAGSLSAQEIDAALSPLVAHLEAVAADPSNPVPPTP